jgi:hypothetical protein
MVASQRDDQGRSQVPRRAGQDRFRRRVTSENLSVSGSAHRRLLAQVNMSSVAEVSRLDIVSLSRPRRVADQRVKRAPQEKEYRACRLNRHHRRRSSSDSRRSNEGGRLPQPITARDRGGRKVGRRGNQKKRHRQVSNNFGAITPAAPERENSGAASFVAAFDSFAPAQLTF